MRLEGKSAVIFVEDLVEEIELLYPKYRLIEEGVKVKVAGPEVRVFKGKNGYAIKADVSFDEINVNDYDVLVIPGGYAPDRIRRNKTALELTRKFYESGKVVAFICHAGWVPISAGILRGKKVTGFFSIKDDLVNAGAEYIDSEVVIDGNLISSRTPDDLPAFCRAIISALSD
ncbi:type 1 glutamine amidotransferase domain-containing protein [Candidatus Kryptonium thompsonii]|uniref:type 1 glutamine amidotransferase domain-containing protein n=1 Tax=Candidatus Kryptonium thompsonii TaxID=1633631 RepID=UPI0007073469|nr:type 1 glutamine amidotransferase domain-containing protein [Candidatus Kryptonium thompsoni]CUT02020.1 protease I [Candidatus Kryptonium thompsoni]